MVLQKGKASLTLILPDILSRVTSHTGHFDPHIVFCVLS